MTPSATELDEVHGVLARLGLGGLDAQVTRLAGLTNRVYRVQGGGQDIALRIPGRGIGRIVDRRNEDVQARIAAAAGIGPAVLRFEPDGVMATRFLPEAQPLSAAALRNRPGSLDRAVAALHALHSLAAPFPGTFEIEATVHRYRRFAASGGSAEPADLSPALGLWSGISARLQAHPTPLRPCHVDPTGTNLLDDGYRVWLIDWEYAGVSDPAWDLAYLSVMAQLDEPLDRRLLAAYFGRPPTPPEAARFEVLKAAVQLVAALWALAQAALGDRAADFPAYAADALRSFHDRTGSAAFAAALDRLSGDWDIGARPVLARRKAQAAVRPERP